MKNNKIVFTNMLDVNLKYCPKPASSFIPDWYKKTDSYIEKIKKPNGSGTTSATIKRCMPVFDSINAGYIITTYVDVYVSSAEATYVDPEDNKEKNIKFPKYEWPSLEPVKFHDFIQAPLYPRAEKNISYPKWSNPWGIKTPKGYSALFISPMHRDIPFKILEGVVDTDKYSAPVNFPFTLNDISWEGLIPAGTPIAQVIPFKRDSWSMEIGGNDEFNKNNKIIVELREKFFDSYKNLYRSDKEYK